MLPYVYGQKSTSNTKNSATRWPKKFFRYFFLDFQTHLTISKWSNRSLINQLKVHFSALPTLCIELEKCIIFVEANRQLLMSPNQATKCQVCQRKSPAYSNSGSYSKINKQRLSHTIKHCRFQLNEQLFQILDLYQAILCQPV